MSGGRECDEDRTRKRENGKRYSTVIPLEKGRERRSGEIRSLGRLNLGEVRIYMRKRARDL